ncbi:hypothetical protein R1flu_028471 [Riccia fluitans]|uniref:HMA domain-containing protein n=1 Tax=Riccia fluitans TaxID=41844 RepID=A0ABD1XQU3_9MARC
MARLMQILTRRASRANCKLPSKLVSQTLSPKRIELRVPMCCECCEENVREQLTTRRSERNQFRLECTEGGCFESLRRETRA